MDGFCLVRDRNRGRMTCDFTSFIIVFQSYQVDGWVLMKSCVQWNPVMIEKDPCLKRGLNPGPQYQLASA